MTAVVTGSAGFVGRMLVAALAERGPVVGIDRLPQISTTQPSRPGVTAIEADLLDDHPDVRAALADATVVHHLAGCPDVRDARPDVELRRHRDNVLATAAVLAAVGPGTAVLVASSSSVYGGSRGGRPSAERDRLRPRGGYARSKVLVEELCAASRVTVVRPFTIAGEGQRPGMALSRWIEAARRGEPLPVFGSLHRTRDITDVRDAVRALVELGELAAAGHRIGTVNIGTGTPVALGEIVAAVGRVLELPVRPLVTAAEAVEVPHTLADVTRLRGLLGWTPRSDLDAIIARQLAYGPSELLAPAG